MVQEVPLSSQHTDTEIQMTIHWLCRNLREEISQADLTRSLRLIRMYSRIKRKARVVEVDWSRGETNEVTGRGGQGPGQAARPKLTCLAH